MIGPVFTGLRVVCALAESAGVTIGAAVTTVVVTADCVVLLPLSAVDASQSVASPKRIAATALRRTAPAAAAGRWELPGGKVEPDEDPGAALVRELREELGVTAVVVGWLAGEAAIGETHRLRVAGCRSDDEPRPTEHDAVRRLGADELDDVDWLDPDRPFLSELRGLLLAAEEPSA